MHDAIQAIQLHCMSMDDEPSHDKCPTGPDSWCFCQKAVANGEEPGPHKGNVKTPLRKEVAIVMKATYDRLSSKNYYSDA